MPAITTITPTTDTRGKVNILDAIRLGLCALMLAVTAMVGGATTVMAHTPDEAPMMCPVMTDEEIDTKISLEYEGQTVYFCCQKCRLKFERAPQRYASSAATTGGIINISGPVTAQSNTHATNNHDHGHTSDSTQIGVLTLFGRFHPMVVHFPIALLITAALARCLMLAGSFGWAGPAVRFCVLLGGVSAVFAATLGWLNAGWPGGDESLGDVMFNHRWLGVGTAVWGVVLITMVEMESRKPSIILSRLTTLGLIVGAGLVGLTGRFGGILVFGADYLPW